MEQSPVDARAEAVLRFARAGHEAGYPTADLEERVLALGRSFGLPAVEVSATPTLIDVSVGPFPDQRNYTLRVRPTAVDLDAIARLDALVQEVLDGGLDAGGALAALKRAEDEPVRHPWPLLLAGYALGGVALAPVLGGGWRDAAAAALVGLVVGGVAISTRRTAQTEPMVAPVAALAASFTAVVLVKLGLDVSADIITLAALVTLLPGMTLTIGVRELSTEHLQSGVANTASAVVQLFGLAFGVAVGRSIATSWFGDIAGTAPHPASFAIQIVAALVAALAFTLTLRARLHDVPLVAAATCLAIAAHEVGVKVFGDQAAVFVAALAIGLVGGLAAARLRRSLLIFVVPGILMLVPGSTGFESVLRLLTDRTASGVTAAFDTIVTAMSIAYGLMVSTVFMPRRLRR